jgi:hypothetical protein
VLFLCVSPRRRSVHQIVVSEPGWIPRSISASLISARGNALPRGRQFAQHVLVVGQQRLAMPADLAWFRAAGLAHAPHQLDRCRRTHRKPCCRLTSRAALLNLTNQPLP